jgi:hypothetical protein
MRSMIQCALIVCVAVATDWDIRVGYGTMQSGDMPTPGWGKNSTDGQLQPMGQTDTWEECEALCGKDDKCISFDCKSSNCIPHCLIPSCLIQIMKQTKRTYTGNGGVTNESTSSSLSLRSRIACVVGKVAQHQVLQVPAPAPARHLVRGHQHSSKSSAVQCARWL